MTPTEHMNAVEIALSAEGWLVTRVNCGLSFRQGRPIHGAPPGTADLIVCAAGVYVEVEVKCGSGRLSPEQKNRQAAVEKRGGAFVVARDPAETVATIHAILKGTQP